MIFSSSELQINTRNSRIVHVDGTFRVCPRPFYQLYTVHCWHLSRCFPVFYMFLPGSSSRIYPKLCQFLETKLLNAEIFVMDMELAVRNAIIASFEHSKIIFCFFHFCQSHWRKIQSLGYTCDYGEDIELARKFRMFSALAFVPEHYVIQAFEKLLDVTADDQRFDEFIGYFELQFIGRMTTDGQRSNPRIKIENWNQHSNVQNSISRTNNRVEGWNRRIADLADCSHPHAYKLVQIIKADMDNSHINMVQAESGQTAPPRKVSDRYVGERILQIFRNTNFEEGFSEEVVQFLTSITRIVAY